MKHCHFQIADIHRKTQSTDPNKHPQPRPGTNVLCTPLQSLGGPSPSALPPAGEQIAWLHNPRLAALVVARLSPRKEGLVPSLPLQACTLPTTHTCEPHSLSTQPKPRLPRPLLHCIAILSGPVPSEPAHKVSVNRVHQHWPLPHHYCHGCATRSPQCPRQLA